jgi:ABC-type transport system involved in multi-copper enzyme maturation permease subunit
MNDTLLHIRTLALKEVADVRRTRLLAVMTLFMLAASFVSLVVAAMALRGEVAAYASSRELLLSMGKSVDALLAPEFAPLTLLRAFIESIEIIGAVLGIVLGHRAAAAERGRNTLALLLTRPMSGGTFIAGKCVGNLAVVFGVLLLTFTSAVLGLIFIGDASLTADDLARVGVVFAAALLYVGFFFALGLLLALNMRRSAHAVLLAFSLWIVFVLVMPQIGDTLDPDNQVGAGVFRTLGIAKLQEQEIMQSFSNYERLRDAVEQSSPAKHFERLAFAELGIKNSYAGQAIGTITRDRVGDLVWLAGLFGSLLGALALLPLNITTLKER